MLGKATAIHRRSSEEAMGASPGKTNMLKIPACCIQHSNPELFEMLQNTEMRPGLLLCGELLA